MGILVFLVAFSFKPIASHAAPVPSLSYVGVQAITSDGNDFVWTDVPKYAMSTSTVMKGSSIVLAIEVLGTERPGTLDIYHDGVNVTSQAIHPLPDSLITSNKVVIGRTVYFQFPTNVLKEGTEEQGSFIVTANDYYTNAYYSQGFNFPIDDSDSTN